MIIRRGERPRSYTVVPNDVIENKALTWEARGLLVYLLSKPNHWNVNRDHLATEALNGVRSVRTILGELETAGYLLRRRSRGEGGRIVWECVVYDQAQPTAVTTGAVPTGGRSADGSSTDGSSTDGAPSGGERAALVSTDLPTTEEVSTEESPPSPTSERDPQMIEAERITKAHWDWCHEQGQPTPTLLSKGNRFLALRNIVRGLIEAGYASDELAEALRSTPTFTVNAMTMTLRQNRARTPTLGGPAMTPAQRAIADHRARRTS